MIKKILKALQPWLLRLLILPPIMVGIVVLAIAIQQRSGPEKVPESEVARTLRVVTVESMDYVPRAIGYGTSRPSQVWEAIAEVKGRVVELHPNLKTGSFVSQGELLVRVDETDTKLAISRLEAEIAKAGSSISELLANKENLEVSVELERQVLKVAEQELLRNERLVEKNAGSHAEVDSQRRAVLGQRQKVQSIVSNLNLLPSQLEAARANLAVTEANLVERQRDLRRIEIRAPFDCRIGPVELELNQFVATGKTLFEAQSTDSVEIEAQVAVRNMRSLFNEELRKKDLAEDAADSRTIDVKRYFDLEVVVRYSAGSDRYERVGSFERLREQLDSQTRSIGVVVSIKNPFKTLVSGPPPVSGTYCEVELRGQPRPSQTVIPRSSIQDGHVYVIDQENRLQRKRVRVFAYQSEFAVLDGGLEVGEVLVVSDPTPAVNGMLVDPVADKELAALVKAQAGGEGAIR